MTQRWVQKTIKNCGFMAACGKKQKTDSIILITVEVVPYSESAFCRIIG
jgi:hypothetical protein